MTKQTASGLTKIGFGSLRIASGILTVAGKGLLGGYLKRHDLHSVAIRVAGESIKGGFAMCRDGVEELRKQ